MPNKEVEVEMPEGSSFVRRTDTGNQPNSVPYESQFRRYNDNENVTLTEEGDLNSCIVEEASSIKYKHIIEVGKP